MRGENRHQHDGKAHVCDGLTDLDCRWGNLVFAFRKRIRDLSDLYPGSGLTVDAPIEFHGVDVGKVKNIRLVSPRSVSIVLSIDKSAPLTSATVATITSRGLATRGCTGYVYISLDDVGIDSRPLITRPSAPYPIIPTAPSKIMTLDTTIYQVRDNVRVITDLLQSLLDKKTIMALQH
jgi:phospholipid/cholesterol/gamma-HCH transport system substrate-binding protein